ncbi:hypothetical protein D9619_007742 [Psilocybe cf. subviscida]|uniref:Nephrocystin 3-like N-terminal domain-containing protein n=1 Tax=Psilocybe cf. subviscida TaxID=2480587 RepID=A0A8H5ATJ9_9AGAR|nr:hypothetical protein D9619_007742 [Psilocybe cf. subviscida]
MSNDQPRTTINTVTAGRDASQTNIYGDYHEHRGEDGWVTLSKQINPDALYDAASRLSARCQSGTRNAILHLITKWMEGQTMPYRKVLWLHGSVGLGKSAIAEKIARDWHRPSLGRYIASYFFSPQQEKQATSGHLFIKTIVYQLGLAIPKFKQRIVKCLTDDPILLSKTVEPLLEALVIDPVTSPQFAPPELFPVIIIDGLDQCASTEVQMDIIQKVIGRLSSLPFRFLITSRPEQHLREAFNNPALAAITEHISLDGYPGTDDDIRSFLAEGFADILRRRADIMRHVPTPWPTPSDLNYFASKASGQFLYATMVLQYVDAAGTLPTEQLKILKSSVGDKFSSLDGLYIAILNTCHKPNQGLLQRVLTMMNILHCPQRPELYEDLLGAQRGLVTVTLGNVHSIIRCPNFAENADERAHYHSRADYDHTQGLRLRHESFRDFLEDPARSGQYALRVPEESEVLIVFVVRELLVKFMIDGHPIDGEVAPCQETWGYLKEHLHTHLLDSEPDVLQRALTDLEEFFPMVKRRVIGPEKRRNFSADHSHWAVDVVLNEDDLLQRGEETLEDRLKQLYQQYRNLLDKLYHRVLQSSSELCEHLPALLVSCKRAIPVQWMQDIFSDNISALPRAPHSDAVIHRWGSPFWARYSSVVGTTTDVLVLNAHFVAFMLDASRCGQFHRSPEKALPTAFRQILGRVFSSDWLLQSRSPEALACLDKILKSLLAPKIFGLPSYSADDPRMLVLNGLVSMDYGVSSLSASPAPSVTSAWQTMLKVLRWLYDQRQQTRKQPNEGLAKLFQDASDNIYRQILSIEGTVYPVVTVIKPILTVVAPDRHSVSRRQSDVAGNSGLNTSTTTTSRATPRTPLLPPSLSNPNDDGSQNHVSDTLLLLYGVRHSLDSFLKSRERAGTLHVQANAYHTQLAEICLELCHDSAGAVGNNDRLEEIVHDHATPTDNVSVDTDWRVPIVHRAWGYHLERAQPTIRLLFLLRSMQPGDWLAGGLLHQGSKDKDKVKSRSVGIITKWLKDLAKQPTDIIQRWESVSDDLAKRKSGSSMLQRKTNINSMRSSSSSIA